MGSSFLVISTRAVREPPLRTAGILEPSILRHANLSAGWFGAFKTVSTKQANLAKDTPGQVLWQRNYYERIIRDDEEWNRIREYIANNPLKWEEDSENPAGRV